MPKAGSGGKNPRSLANLALGSKPWGPDNPPPRSPGRPRSDFTKAQCEALFRERGPEFVAEQTRIALTAKSPAVRLMALDKSLDRAVGKATQHVEHSGSVTLTSVAIQFRAWVESIGQLEAFDRWLAEHEPDDP